MERNRRGGQHAPDDQPCRAGRRTLNAACVFAALLFLAGADVSGAGAQQPGGSEAAQTDALVRELIRKAEAKETESGFCARVDWRRIEDPSTPERQNALLAELTKSVGTELAFRGLERGKGETSPPVVCGLIRYVSPFEKGGRPCVRLAAWACVVGKACAASPPGEFCQQPGGSWKEQ